MSAAAWRSRRRRTSARTSPRTTPTMPGAPPCATMASAGTTPTAAARSEPRGATPSTAGAPRTRRSCAAR
eukprot:14727026-Alexandrium_andersonii.AAC.1